MKKLGFIVLTLFPVLLQAQVVSETASAASDPLSSAYMGKLLLSLLLVIGIIFLLAWSVKRFNFVPQHGKGVIQVLSTLSVGTRDRIALIQVGEEQLLIAVSPGSISKLHRLKKPVDMSQNKAATQGSFKQKMNELLVNSKMNNDTDLHQTEQKGETDVK